MEKESAKFSENEEKILKAALKVVGEQTISGTRMRLIADKAGMVQSNVHYYYKTKEQLLSSLQEYILNEIYETQRAAEEKSEDTLEAQVHVFFEQKRIFLTRKKDFDYAEIDFVMQSKINKEIRERFQQSYEEWRNSFLFLLCSYCPEISEEDKEMIPYMAVSLLEGATVQSMTSRNNFDADRYFDYAEKQVLQMIENARAKAA